MLGGVGRLGGLCKSIIYMDEDYFLIYGENGAIELVVSDATACKATFVLSPTECD